MIWAGLDLAASNRRPSAIAVGESWKSVELFTVYSDEAIYETLAAAQVVWVDAPLSRGETAFRDCDRLLHKEGIMPLPLTWAAMRKLHERALSLQRKLPHMEWRETFPWSVYLWLGAKRCSPKNPALFEAWAREQGYSGCPTSVHEWDALACWTVGWLYKKGEARCFSGKEGAVWIP